MGRFRVGKSRRAVVIVVAAAGAVMLLEWTSPTMAATVSGGIRSFAVDREYHESSITLPLLGGAPTQTISFEQFDSNFGMLQNVILSFNSNVYGNFDILGDVNAFIVGGDLGDTLNVSFRSALALRNGGIDLTTGAVTASMTCYAPNRDCTASSGARSADPGSFPDNPLILTTASDISPFIGHGGIDLVATISLFDPSILGPTGSEAFWGAGTSVSWSGTISMTYDYTPVNAEVPEPTSLVLVGTALGLGSLYWGRRRRR